MTQKLPTCVDCGEKIDRWSVSQTDYFGGLCAGCLQDRDRCVKCGHWFPLADMRQAYCRDCRRSYDQARWARQRAARA